MTTTHELIARLEQAITADGNAYEVVLSISEAKQVLEALKMKTRPLPVFDHTAPWIPIANALEWLPIETAPKDVTPIQASIPGHGADNIIAWMNSGDGSAWCFIEDQEPPECWTAGVCWAENENGKQSVQPTHWKPLP